VLADDSLIRPTRPASSPQFKKAVFSKTEAPAESDPNYDLANLTDGDLTEDDEEAYWESGEENVTEKG
jgi:hypothetical protein